MGAIRTLGFVEHQEFSRPFSLCGFFTTVEMFSGRFVVGKQLQTIVAYIVVHFF